MADLLKNSRKLMAVAALLTVFSVALSADDFVKDVVVAGTSFRQYGCDGRSFEKEVEVDGAKVLVTVQKGVLTLTVLEGRLELSTLGEVPVGALNAGDSIELSGFVGGNAGIIIGSGSKMYLPPVVRLDAKLLSDTPVTLKNVADEDVVCQKDVLVAAIPVGTIATLDANDPSGVNTGNLIKGEAVEINGQDANGNPVTFVVVRSIDGNDIQVFTNKSIEIALNSSNLNANDFDSKLLISASSAIEIDQTVSFIAGEFGITATTQNPIGSIQCLSGEALLTVISTYDPNIETKTMNMTAGVMATITNDGVITVNGATQASGDTVESGLGTSVELPSIVAGATTDDPGALARDVSK
ncbi:MAG: hypothetical protein ABIH86_03310 [Planctomycetota bacterium]